MLPFRVKVTLLPRGDLFLGDAPAKVECPACLSTARWQWWSRAVADAHRHAGRCQALAGLNADPSAWAARSGGVA